MNTFARDPATSSDALTCYNAIKECKELGRPPSMCVNRHKGQLAEVDSELQMASSACIQGVAVAADAGSCRVNDLCYSFFRQFLLSAGEQQFGEQQVEVEVLAL